MRGAPATRESARSASGIPTVGRAMYSGYQNNSRGLHGLHGSKSALSAYSAAIALSDLEVFLAAENRHFVRSYSHRHSPDPILLKHIQIARAIARDHLRRCIAIHDDTEPRQHHLL